MGWKYAESAVRPNVLDTTSSKTYNFVRRNIEEKEVEDMDGQTMTIYTYEELAVLKEDWEMFTQITANDARITDVEDVITEIIGGGEL